MDAVTATAVLDVARAELGYVEGPRSNENKYAAEIAPLTQRQPWCAVFVSWVFQRADVALPLIQAQAVPDGGFAYCPFAVTYARRNGQAVPVDQAEPGDIVLFDWGRDGVADHVGIVERWDGPTLVCLEGNTSLSNQSNGGQVMRRWRARPDVACIWRPTVSLRPAPPESEPKVKHVADYPEEAVRTALINSGVAVGQFARSDPQVARWRAPFPGRPPTPIAATPNTLVQLRSPIGVYVDGEDLVLDISFVDEGGSVVGPFDVWVTVA